MDRLGEALRALRLKRNWSQERLAARAQVTARALRYWEANRQQPREVELESVLTALAATPQERAQVCSLLTAPRSVRLAQNETMGVIPGAILGPLPGIGDLLRALRLRRGWTQERVAEVMQVNRSTVIRWEATRTLPSEEDIARLGVALDASPEEQTALRDRRLAPSSWPSQLTLEACSQQYEALLKMRGGDFTLVTLADLHLIVAPFVKTRKGLFLR